MKKMVLRLMVGMAAFLSVPVCAQTSAPPSDAPDFSTVQIKTTDLGNNVWMLEGFGGNVTVVVGKKAVIMVDTMFAPLHDKIRAAISRLSDKPIRYVINTHRDHVGGNELFAKDGAIVVAHGNLRGSMARGIANALTGIREAPAVNAALPAITYTKDMQIDLGDRTVNLIHMPKAYSMGDTLVWIPDANVLAASDIVSWGNRFPIVDVGDGGDIDATIAALDAMLDLVNDRTKIVAGHGPVMTRGDMLKYRDLLVDARAAIRALKVKGMTEMEVVAAHPLAGDILNRAGADELGTTKFVRLVYRTVD